MDAGLASSLRGGGAEGVRERVHRRFCHDKADASRWLSSHRTAHRLGMKSNVTLLRAYRDERGACARSHAARPRAADETGGFQAFIPCRSTPTDIDAEVAGAQPARTRCASRGGAAHARQLPHVKAFWIAAGVELAKWPCGSALTTSMGRAGRAHLPHGRLAHARGADDARHRAHHSRRRPHACRARHVLQRGERAAFAFAFGFGEPGYVGVENRYNQ